jgi:hypothetical protein
MFSLKKVVLVTLSLMSTMVLANNTVPSTEKASYVFIQNSASAVLNPVNNKPGTYTLTMKNVQPYINYFSERPNRMTGVMPTDKFFQAWQKGQDSFAKDAPNVSVSGIKLHGIYQQKVMNYVLALSNPHYDVKKNEITYDAKSLENGHIALNKAITLHNVVVFLDDGWCPSCCCG